MKALFEKSPPVSGAADTGRMTPEEVHALALARLKEAGVAVGSEMRHTSSLSLVAILRRWQMRTAVHSGRHDFSLSGELTAYGRGVDFEAARAACAMEVVERCSSFSGFDARGPVGCAHTPATVHARLSDLCANKSDALDPNDLALEAPYRDEPLYWVEALEQTPQGPRSIFFPAQCVFLFCNLDEIKLFSALGSTGLGTGVSTAGIGSIAVLPLKNLSGDPGQDYLADGLTEALITERGKAGGLRVLSYQSVIGYRGTQTPLPRIARELGVEAVLEGAVLHAGERVRITANLVQASPERHLWAESYEFDLRDVLAVQRELARDVAGRIRFV